MSYLLSSQLEWLDDAKMHQSRQWRDQHSDVEWSVHTAHDARRLVTIVEDLVAQLDAAVRHVPGQRLHQCLADMAAASSYQLTARVSSTSRDQ